MGLEETVDSSKPAVWRWVYSGGKVALSAPWATHPRSRGASLEWPSSPLSLSTQKPATACRVTPTEEASNQSFPRHFPKAFFVYLYNIILEVKDRHCAIRSELCPLHSLAGGQKARHFPNLLGITEIPSFLSLTTRPAYKPDFVHPRHEKCLSESSTTALLLPNGTSSCTQPNLTTPGLTRRSVPQKPSLSYLPAFQRSGTPFLLPIFHSTNICRDHQSWLHPAFVWFQV